jgi:hypothetical protein
MLLLILKFIAQKLEEYTCAANVYIIVQEKAVIEASQFNLNQIKVKMILLIRHIMN